MYFQEERHSTLDLGNGDVSHPAMLEIPGLLIQHCKSVHQHLPVVDSDHDHKTCDESSFETVIKITDTPVVENEKSDEEEDDGFEYSNETFCSHQSSYEILVIPSRHSSLHVGVGSLSGGESPIESSRATLIHLIDQEPVMVTTAVYSSSTTLSSTAHQVVLDSLKNAATQLGFDEEEIFRALDIPSSTPLKEQHQQQYPSNGECLSKESLVMVSQSVLDYSKEIAELSLVGAAISLGYDKEEISSVLGVKLQSSTDSINHKMSEDSLSVLDDMYSITVKDIAVTAIKQAAVSLGYTEEEAETALSTSFVRDGTSSSNTSISILAAELAKTAIVNASNKLGLKTDSVKTLVNEIDSRMSSVVISNYSLLKSSSSTMSSGSGGGFKEEPFIVVTHNALRNAALRLGFSVTEVDAKIGPEKVLRCTDPVANNTNRKASNNSKTTSRCCISPINECEYLIGKYDVFTMSSTTILAQGGSYYECLANASEEITRTVLNNALEIVTGSTKSQESLMTRDYTSDNSMSSAYDLKLERTAKGIVDTAIKRAKRIVAADYSVSDGAKQRQMLEEKKRMRSFALKYSMMVIGSAAKQLGYTDERILKALTKDLTRNKKGKI